MLAILGFVVVGLIYLIGPAVMASWLTRRKAGAVLFAAALAGAGCAGHQAPQVDPRDAWVGQDINALILEVGAPSSTFTLPNGSQMFTWAWRGVPLVYATRVGPIVAQAQCDTVVLVTNGRITNWQERGGGC